MILFKLLQEFLLPSVFVLVLILIGAIFLFWRRKKKIGKILLILGILFYYLFSITPVADLILLPLESQYNPIQKEELDKADKIVLLSGGRESDVLRASEALRIFNFQFTIFNEFSNSSPASLYEALRAGNFQIIISGRDPLNPGREEAEKIKEFLVERGIPDENIILERKSRNTFESAKNVKGLVEKEPFFLVTSAYHMPRSMAIFKKLNMNPIPAPTDFKIKEKYDVLDFFPQARNLRNSDLAFHEYFGILFYKVKYN